MITEESFNQYPKLMAFLNATKEDQVNCVAQLEKSYTVGSYGLFEYL